jgi:hypothetical protein
MPRENPFYYNLPTRPDDFLGRWPLVDEIVADLCCVRPDSWAVIGGRRFGKSSVLKAVESRLANRLTDCDVGDWLVFPLLVDLKRCKPTSEQHIYVCILRYLYRALQRSRALNCDFASTDLHAIVAQDHDSLSFFQFENVLEDLVRRMQNPFRLVLLLDEVESMTGFGWSETLFNQLRALIYDGPLAAVVKLVLTGSANVIRARYAGSPLLNAVKIEHLASFSEIDLQTLIARSDEISDEVAIAVRVQSGGHPFIAQYLLHHLWDDGLAQATLAQVEQVARQMRQRRNADLQGWWEAIGDSGQQVYAVLAAGQGWMEERALLAEVQDAVQPLGQGLAALCYHGLAVRDSSGRRYRAVGKLFFDWFVLNGAERLAGTAMQPDRVQIIIEHIDQHIGSLTNIAGDVGGPVAPGVPDDYFDIQIRVYKPQPNVQSYAVEALLSDGSHFEGGILHLDRQALAVAASQYHGLQLFDALFPNSTRRAYEQAMIYAEAKTAGRLRVRLWIDNNAAELQSVVWEQLHHQVRGATLPIAAAADMPFSRYFGLAIPEPQPVSERPVRMLLAIANPINLSEYHLASLNVETETENLLAALGDLQRARRIQCTLMPGRTGLSGSLRLELRQAGYQIQEGVTGLTNILQLLHRGEAYHILHLLGHGGFSRRESTAVLYLEDDNGNVQHVKDQALIDRLAAIRPLPHLIFLSACSSAQRELGDSNPFVGLAPKLIRMGIPAVVAMQDDIPMLTARKLTREFYSCLLEHGLVDKAMNQARLSLYDAERTDWTTPVLFMRLKDGRLLAAEFGDEPQSLQGDEKTTSRIESDPEPRA